ncbi:MAG TPA: asparagine synthase (glutamine-hydrolyzing) [Syntrophorhabdaceae bacterium]|nr:asparagine synthase (glutamine-hydrolyzing) [Syntrophorhabdaceae bacterium]
MCRIVGFVDGHYKGQYDMYGVLEEMRDSMFRGGPDDAGQYIHEDKGLAVGHRRLSILDLSPMGHQPMGYDNLVITYNGEVYNFREIRRELEDCGYTFQSNSDTEVVLKTFHKWGLNGISRFRGMWAFAVWDNKSETVTLCRDRVGVKPLYWYFKNSLFMFASELKAFCKHPTFLKDVDRKALSLYFQFGYIPAPYSIFKGVRKLDAGCVLKFDVNRQEYAHERYWDVKKYYLTGFQSQRKPESNSDEEIETELEGILEESFKLRLVSDVPVGVFLSGGIDSSLVATLLQKNLTGKLKTFTIGFHGENQYNEAPSAREVAERLSTDHHEYYFDAQDVADLLHEIPLLYDEPFGDSSALPTYLVSMIARRYVKVALSADGGDELFCGYNFFVRPFVDRLDPYFRLGDRTNLSSFILKLADSAPSERMLYVCHPTKNNFRGKLNRMKYLLKKIDFSEGWDLRTALMYVEFIRYLPDDILVKVDRATMGVSLEGREPFLDNRIVEYACQLPMKFKYRNKVRKHILRRIASKYLPNEALNRPKQGFSLPLNSEPYRSKLHELFDCYLDDRMLRKTGMLNVKACSNLVRQWNSEKLSYEKLWYLLNFQMWAERYL